MEKNFLKMKYRSQNFNSKNFWPKSFKKLWNMQDNSGQKKKKIWPRHFAAYIILLIASDDFYAQLGMTISNNRSDEKDCKTAVKYPKTCQSIFMHMGQQSNVYTDTPTIIAELPTTWPNNADDLTRSNESTSHMCSCIFEEEIPLNIMVNRLHINISVCLTKFCRKKLGKKHFGFFEGQIFPGLALTKQLT